MDTTNRLVYEQEAWRNGHRNVLFLDEAGRGCLFGPVCVAGVMYRHNAEESDLPRARDSKKLSKTRRDKLYDEILSTAVASRIVLGSPADIDQHNILGATMNCMREIIVTIEPRPDFVFVDGNCLPKLIDGIQMRAVPKLDDLSVSCASASILAKTYRDRHVEQMVQENPVLEKYGLLKNKGYPSKEHRRALAQHGPTEHHRKSFKWTTPDN